MRTTLASIVRTALVGVAVGFVTAAAFDLAGNAGGADASIVAAVAAAVVLDRRSQQRPAT